MESSAKCPSLCVMFPIWIPVILGSLLTDLVKPSTIARNRIGDNGHPWAVPCLISKGRYGLSKYTDESICEAFRYRPVESDSDLVKLK
eukprot:6195710-Pleurochrysis_carterae.AAC.2